MYVQLQSMHISFKFNPERQQTLLLCLLGPTLCFFHALSEQINSLTRILPAPICSAWIDVSLKYLSTDRRAAIFAPMNIFNEAENAWNLFYIGYTCQPGACTLLSTTIHVTRITWKFFSIALDLPLYEKFDRAVRWRDLSHYFPDTRLGRHRRVLERISTIYLHLACNKRCIFL